MEKIIINKENFEEVAEKFIKGCYEANNYNSECFSVMEVCRAKVMSDVMCEMIERSIKAGYSSCLYDALLSKYEMSYDKPKDYKVLKKEIDDDFIIDMSEFQQAYEYVNAVFSYYYKGVNKCNN